MKSATVEQKSSDVAHRMRILIVLSALAMLLFVEGCVASEAPTSDVRLGSCSLDIAQTSTDEEKIEIVLRSEGELVVKQQIDSLMALWAEESRIVDAQHTPNNDADDQLWQGKDAIRHRYVRIVFPGAPTEIIPSDLQIQLNGDSATVSASTNIGNEKSKAGDRWQLVQQNGCWQIQQLTYNLEAEP